MPKTDRTEDLPVLLSFPDSATGEAVIAELKQRLRHSESALALHKERYDDAAIMGDDDLVKHIADADAFERSSARLSVAIEHARKRLAEIHKAELQQAGANARIEALEIVQECGSLLRNLLDQATAIATELSRWSARREDVSRLNEIARAGGAEPVVMPELPEDAESAAEAGAQVGRELGDFLNDRSHEVWRRKQRELRVAEAEAKRQAEAPTEEEAAKLRAKGFDLAILSREPRDAEEGYKRILVRQEIRWMRGQDAAPAVTTRI